MKYLKVWTDFESVLAPLNDDEIGRLFLAMLRYAATGEEPSGFTGNEVFLWAVAKRDIDTMAEKSETLRQNGSKGGIARSKNKQALANDSKTNQTEANGSNENQTEANDSLKEKKRNEKKGNENKGNRFTPPTVDEIRQYCTERGNGIDPEYFFTYYENRGWKLSNGRKMKDWKLAIVTWEKNGFNKTRSAPVKTVPAQNYGQRPYEDEDEAARRRMFAGVV